ncbi:MAG: BrnT family toxin [Phycisphaerae bacterium]|nr:BrnT family toxin [Phycisphaerae bacterium]
MGYEFEWNPRKSASNRRKHGVTFEEAATAFADPRSLNQFDPDHSIDEDRFLLMGKSRLDRILVVSYTDRPPRVRIISARLATRRERNQYEHP